MTITNVIQKALDSDEEIRMVGLDFSTVSNHVDHKAHIYKLRQLDAGVPFLNILTKYLTDSSE